jgi:hypothetical protein
MPAAGTNNIITFGSSISIQSVEARSAWPADCYRCRHLPVLLLLLPLQLPLQLLGMLAPRQRRTQASTAPASCVPPTAAAAAAQLAAFQCQHPLHLLWMLCQYLLLLLLLWMLCQHLLLLLALSGLQQLLMRPAAARHLQQQGQCSTPIDTSSSSAHLSTDTERLHLPHMQTHARSTLSPMRQLQQLLRSYGISQWGAQVTVAAADYPSQLLQSHNAVGNCNSSLTCWIQLLQQLLTAVQLCHNIGLPTHDKHIIKHIIKHIMHPKPQKATTCRIPPARSSCCRAVDSCATLPKYRTVN